MLFVLVASAAVPNMCCICSSPVEAAVNIAENIVEPPLTSVLTMLSVSCNIAAQHMKDFQGSLNQAMKSEMGSECQWQTDFSVSDRQRGEITQLLRKLHCHI